MVFFDHRFHIFQIFRFCVSFRLFRVYAETARRNRAQSDGKFTCALIGLDILFWKSPPVSGGERSKGVSTHKQPPLAPLWEWNKAVEVICGQLSSRAICANFVAVHFGADRHRAVCVEVVPLAINLLPAAGEHLTGGLVQPVPFLVVGEPI